MSMFVDLSKLTWEDGRIMGSSGRDDYNGTRGDDRYDGGFGDDQIGGGRGSDILVGNYGDDRLRGEDGDDDLDGGVGNDRVAGGFGDDLVAGGAGNDDVRGDDGSDELDGGIGADKLDGGAGDDVLRGGFGDDILTGGRGADSFYFASASEGGDTIMDFASGLDVIELAFGVDQDDVGYRGFEGRDDAFGTDPTLIYSEETGRLFFDADGRGGADQILIATLTRSPELDRGDVVFV